MVRMAAIRTRSTAHRGSLCTPRCPLSMSAWSIGQRPQESQHSAGSIRDPRGFSLAAVKCLSRVRRQGMQDDVPFRSAAASRMYRSIRHCSRHLAGSGLGFLGRRPGKRPLEPYLRGFGMFTPKAIHKVAHELQQAAGLASDSARGRIAPGVRGRPAAVGALNQGAPPRSRCRGARG